MKGHYEEFWATAPEGVVETTGADRIVAPMPGTPSLREAIEQGRRGAGYYQQTISVTPGRIEPYLEHYDAQWRPVAEAHGLVHVGAYRTMLGNDNEGITIWALPTWSAWEAIDTGLRQDERARSFHQASAEHRPVWSGKLLAGADQNPLDVGRPL
jgi:hypothetical protein